MGLLDLPDHRHTLVDIGTTLLCISGYNDKRLTTNVLLVCEQALRGALAAGREVQVQVQVYLFTRIQLQYNNNKKKKRSKNRANYTLN